MAASGGSAAADTEVPATRARQRPTLPRPGTGTLVRAAVIAALLLFVLFALPQLMSLYYVDAMTQVAVWSMAALGLGVLVGRVGLVSLGQVAVLAIGAWVAARLLFATAQPYPLVLLEAGLITMLLGTLIGLPALRLRGLYLALITLMLAGALTVVLATTNFPNGGPGFLGYNGSQVHIPPIRRPSIAASDPAYFRYAVVVAVLMFLLVFAHIRTRPGRAWAAVRQSEPAAQEAAEPGQVPGYLVGQAGRGRGQHLQHADAEQDRQPVGGHPPVLQQGRQQRPQQPGYDRPPQAVRPAHQHHGQQRDRVVRREVQ